MSFIDLTFPIYHTLNINSNKVWFYRLKFFQSLNLFAFVPPVFLGLISDLFPSLDVPRKRELEFEKAVKHAACDLKLQPEESFVLKVVQLDELLFVRHSVFIGKFKNFPYYFQPDINFY